MIAGYIILGIAVVVVLWAASTFNGLVRRRNLTAEGWSGIETQLKRRADLIPNLVETVKGYATHERTTFDELARLRSAAQGGGGGGPPTGADMAARVQTEQQISAMIGRVFAVAEAYPELKASANFQSLQHDLADIEDQIQLARRYYNGAARDYNVMREQVPSNLIANGFGFTKADYFEIENAADRAVPKVSFS
jgi:LemA protein